MAIINTETKIPELLASYVHSRRASLGLPAAQTLPFVTGPTNEEQTFPRVMFVAGDASFPHPRRMDLPVIVELQTGTATQDLALETQWTAGVRYALADRHGFMSWLAAQSEEVSTGVDIRKMRLEDAGMAVDDERKVRGRRTQVIFHVRSDELAPPQPL
jgi:hypothetical protein